MMCDVIYHNPFKDRNRGKKQEKKMETQMDAHSAAVISRDG